MKNRVSSILFGVAAATLAGCNGWPETIPYAEAEHKPEKYATYWYAPAEAVPIFDAGHRRYMVMPRPFDLRTTRTIPVSATPAANVVAVAGDEPPYSNLFVRMDDGRTHATGLID